MSTRKLALQIGFSLLPIAIALAVTAVLIILLERDPVEVFTTTWTGAFRDASRLGGVFNFWIPLTLACAGLIITFTAGLWNIGIEGQMVMGAIFAGWGARTLPLPSELLIPACIALAAGGGALWALLAGFLKNRFGVNEIFGGVALNFIALNITIYLISGPWQPPEGGSAQSTQPFPAASIPPSISEDFPVSLLLLALTVGACLLVIGILWRSRWGLMLKATGKNARSALLLGVPTERVSLGAFALCGALAGIAGAHRALTTYNALRPSPAGGIGFLALLVVLLVSYRALWMPFVAFALAAIIAGSTSVKIRMGLDQSLVGVLQGLLVLSILLFNGLRERVLQESRTEIREKDG